MIAFAIINGQEIMRIPYVNQRIWLVVNIEYIPKLISFVDLVFQDFNAWGMNATTDKIVAMNPIISATIIFSYKL